MSNKLQEIQSKHIADENILLEFIGFSKLEDKSPVYRFRLPEECQIIPNIKTLL